MFVVAIHSAMPTGAPRLGLEIAKHLHERRKDVVLLCPEDGAIVEEARRRDVNVSVLAERLDFADPDVLVDTCTRVLEDLRADFVFCNSLAASCWAIAGKTLKATTVLHALELKHEMKTLLNRGRLVKGVGRCADGLVVAAPRVVSDFGDVVGDVPSRVFELGSFIDVAALRSRARQNASANWLHGRELKKSRPVVGMCGVGGVRKGFDRFVSTARALPEFDFLWVGDVTDGQFLGSSIEEARSSANVFVTGWVENPAPFIASFDVFLLTSREDPDPIAALEAYALGVPLVVFTGTGETWRRLGRGCYALYGDFDVPTAVGAIRTVLSSATSLPQELPHALRAEESLDGLGRFLDSLA